MEIFYKIKHEDFKFDVFKDLKYNHRIATMIVWSCCRSFCTDERDRPKKDAYCDFYQGQISNDLGIGIKTLRMAEKRLVELEYIRVLRKANYGLKRPTRYGLGKIGIRSLADRYPITSRQASDTYTNNTKVLLKEDDNSSLRKNDNTSSIGRKKGEPLQEYLDRIERETKKD